MKASFKALATLGNKKKTKQATNNGVRNIGKLTLPLCLWSLVRNADKLEDHQQPAADQGALRKDQWNPNVSGRALPEAIKDLWGETLNLSSQQPRL
ncbi:ku70-binding-like protein [Corchorus olitorius]|uniref:Ku70-binding-like protein n=1 Tax=Corchorus olitorius TaxID=93759 RepID=A0A1R3KD04_9ROSI|nr:ku70-binding-like protein [Corchorus olitorius]